MCGINGLWIYKGRKVDKKLQAMYEESLRYIDTRGGHATGIYTNGKIIKMPLKAREFLRILHVIDRGYAIGSTEILGHTRFATVGSYNVNANNHPFETEDFIFAHNGSYYPTKRFKDADTVIDIYSKTRPETDSFDLLANIQALYTGGKTIPEAIEESLNAGYGAYAFWLYHKKEDKLYLFREDNPLYMAQHKGFLMFASQSTQLPKKLRHKAFLLKPDVLYEVDRKGQIAKHKLNIEEVYSWFGSGKWKKHEWYYEDWLYYGEEYDDKLYVKKKKLKKKDKSIADIKDEKKVVEELIKLSQTSQYMTLADDDSESVVLLVFNDTMADQIIDTLEAFGLYYSVVYKTSNYAEIEIYKTWK